MDFTGSPLAILPCLLVTLRSVRAAIAKSEAERSTPLNGGSQWDSPNGCQTLLSRTVDTYTLPFTSRLAKSRFAKRNNIRRWPCSANNTLKRAPLTETVTAITYNSQWIYIGRTNHHFIIRVITKSTLSNLFALIVAAKHRRWSLVDPPFLSDNISSGTLTRQSATLFVTYTTWRKKISSLLYKRRHFLKKDRHLQKKYVT
jgi:hypothetical protein